MQRFNFGSVYRLGVGNQSALLRVGLVKQTARAERDFATPQYAVVYVWQGEGWFRDDQGRKHRILPGSVYQRFPSMRHDVLWDTQAVRCFLAVPCQVFEILELTGLADRRNPVIEVGVDARLIQQMTALRDELDQAQDAELPSLLTKMQRFLVKLHERARVRRGALPDDEPIVRAMQILTEDIAGRRRLPEIAKMVNMGYSAFRKRFVEQVGLSPRDFRIRRRIERAMEMLTRETWRNKEIAARLGYPDEYAFSAQFKKIAGLSPRAFRRQAT